ncbi:MAG: DNA helicase RecQ [Bacteroidetes bacterium]|nr:MAG: DNA helicase RecQ [Bacteroidota bacterium]
MASVVQEISLKGHLKKIFGFSKFKGEQEEIIKNILNGKDTFVIMPTGGGKSLCYQLPALISEGTAIVVSPLIALMKNQVDLIRGFGTKDNIAHFLNSSLAKAEIIKVKEELTAGKTKILYVAPESLAKEANVEFFKNINISFIAIDEAHCISEWGHDFRPEYRRIRELIDQIGRVPIIALTATATPKVQQDILKNLNVPDATVFKASFNRPNLYYEVRSKVEAPRQIIQYIRKNAGKSGIIYCLSRKQTEALASTLNVNGIRAVPYHAGLEKDIRSKTQDQFLMEDVEVIVATIAFGMGIDKPDVRFVMHYDIPKSLEGYYQETGRSGRDGGEGHCIAFYSEADIQKLEKFLKGKPVAEQEINRQLIQEVVTYSESSVCRRKTLLHYFGEKYEQENCGNCDNCTNPKKKFEGKEDVELLLDSIIEMKEKFKAKHVVHVLTGTLTSLIKQYKHNELEIFGKGTEDDKDERYWNAVVRQAHVAGLLSKDIENYGLLKVTKDGRKFLEKPSSFLLTKDHDFKNPDDEEGEAIISGQGGTALDQPLYKMLKDLVKQVSKKENLQPWIIFQETCLSEMATTYPTTLDELAKVSGVGPGKAQRYGKSFADLIAKYVKDNKIERPQDLIVKSTINKSGLKVFLIQAIDRKLSLEDIADAKGLTMSDLIGELESIVSAGTRVNIGHYINEVIDDDVQDDIYQYFRKADSDSVETALKELGEDEYDEEDVRLMRIKFISEVGN